MKLGSKECGHCGRAFPAHAWPRMRLVQRLASTRVSELMTHWPAGTSVEVRSCLRCGESIARLMAEPLTASG